MTNKDIMFFFLGLFLGVLVGILLCWHMIKNRLVQHLLNQPTTTVTNPLTEDHYHALLDPVHTIMESISQDMLVAERERAVNFAAMREQIDAFNTINQSIHQETQNLRKVFHSSQHRGHWGEMQLLRLIELAGLQNHCDYSLQAGASKNGQLFRPDMTIHLTDNKTLYIDAKTPLDWNFDDTIIEDKRKFSKLFKAHIDNLSRKEYWKLSSNSPEFVIMFLPLESLLQKAIEADTQLLEYAFSHNVIPATPASLLTILKSIALTWKNHSITEEARHLQMLCQQLCDSLHLCHKYFSQLGNQLHRAVDSYNSATNIFNSQIISTGNTIAANAALGKDSLSDIPPLTPR